MRPQSLVYFNWLYGISLVVSAIGIALEPVDPELPIAFAAGLYAIMFAIAMFFWYAISLRASNVMRWIYSVLCGLSLIATLFVISTSNELNGVSLLLSALVSVIDVITVFMLFTPDARDWFASRGSKGVVNPSVFR